MGRFGTPPFIYGWLPSNSRSSSNTGFVRRTITKIADKMATSHDQCPLPWSFLIGFLLNFIYRLLPSNSHSSLNSDFVRATITKMADKMATDYQFELVDTLPSSFITRLLQNFIFIDYLSYLWINSHLSSNMGCAR